MNLKKFEFIKKWHNPNRKLYDISKELFTENYNKIPIDDNAVLIQSYNGDSISGNPYYILLELCSNEKYKHLKKYVVSNWKNYEKNLKFLESKNFKNVELIKIHSEKYSLLLASAKYLVNNATFAPYFIKREGQIYLNTWHGTPLKNMGRRILNAPNELGNSQRNMLMSDYFLSPNDFTLDVMKRDYMLDNIYSGKYVLGGYPRNSAFFDSKSRENLKEKYGLTGKKIVFFMPTWRGALNNRGSDEYSVYTKHALYEMEKQLGDDIVVFAKLHNYAADSLNFDDFTKIRQIPEECETYEFLNIADCLITDYSSVMFDFAVTGKKIVLYCYDAKKYIEHRGMYLDYYSLPFKFVVTEDELISEISNVDDYEPYTSQIAEFIKYDNSDSAKQLCDLVFSGEQSADIKVINGTDFSNGKENVLIFAGSLAKNGITTAFLGLLSGVDKTKRNYIPVFYKDIVEPNKETITKFSGFDYIVIHGRENLTEKERRIFDLYYNVNFNSASVKKTVSGIYKREIQRIFPFIRVDSVIHFSGYERAIMHIFGEMNAKKIWYCHNDMLQEIKTRNNIHVNSLHYSYEHFDKIAAVRENLFAGNKVVPKEKISIVHNVNDAERILTLSEKKIKFDEDTYSSVGIDELNEILNDDSNLKFINVARYSPEKGLDRLILAFDKFRAEYPNAYLIVIGGHGKNFEEIQNLVYERGIKNVILIKSLSNPFSILTKCDCFVLSSYYEGLPMVIMEALILQKKVISTSIDGPKEFLEQGYGYLVDNSEQGILDGMKEFAKTGLPELVTFDTVEFNKKAIEEFELLFD